jgi:membrane fusion protein, multidrug efflux system
MKASIALLFFATLPLAGCSDDKPVVVSTAKAAAPSHPAPDNPAPSEFTASGPITVEQQLDMLSPRDGIIATVNADLGAAVQKGQLLATLDQRQLAADRDAQLARVRSIEADLKNWAAETKVRETDRERARQMWEAKLITEQEFEHAKYKAEGSAFEVQRESQNLNQARSVLESLEIELSRSKIIAPFSGVVARRYVTTGQAVTKNERLFWISAMSPMQVKFMLPAEMMLRVKPGTEVSVLPAYPAATPELAQTAKIVRMSPVVDPASGTFEVVAQIEGSGGGLKPGMTANIKLSSGSVKHK